MWAGSNLWILVGTVWDCCSGSVKVLTGFLMMEKCVWWWLLLFVCCCFCFLGGGVCCFWHGGVEEYDEASNAQWLLMKCVWGFCCWFAGSREICECSLLCEQREHTICHCVRRHDHGCLGHHAQKGWANCPVGFPSNSGWFESPVLTVIIMCLLINIVTTVNTYTAFPLKTSLGDIGHFLTMLHERGMSLGV